MCELWLDPFTGGESEYEVYVVFDTTGRIQHHSMAGRMRAEVDEWIARLVQDLKPDRIFVVDDLAGRWPYWQRRFLETLSPKVQLGAYQTFLSRTKQHIYSTQVNKESSSC